MINYLRWSSGVLLLSIMLCSCAKEKQYGGDSMMNYPDVTMILKDYIEPYQKAPYTYLLTTVQNGKKDSVYLKASDVEWDEMKAPFLKANLYKKSLDKHYTIDVFTDTLYGKITLLLNAIDPKEVVSTMSITAKSVDNKIMTLYTEMRDAGFFITKEYKLLFVNQKSLQIQETTKYPFSKAKLKIQTLTFLN